VVDRLKTKQINNPEVLLLMALAYKRVGKVDDAKALMVSADAAMKDATAGKVEAIKNQFAELYMPDPAATAPNNKKKQ
jgi:hypothetical protein